MLRESSVDDLKASNNLMSTSPQHQAVAVAVAAAGELTTNSISSRATAAAAAAVNAAATATASSDNSCSTIIINNMMTTTTADNSISSSSTSTTDHIVNLINNNSFYPQHPFAPPNQPPMLPLPLPLPPKKKRSLPGNPDPNAEVIAMSPKSLLATNRFLCEVCNKGFQRDQNLQLHRRGHNLPWKLKQRPKDQPIKKKVYVCPEPTCAHHDPARALGDLTGIKKHYCRKHGDKKWKCDKCTKRYAVHSDWKAHSKICGTKEYRCDCGTLFSRRDSFITHRAFCEALAGERRNPLLLPSHQSSSASATTSSPLPLHLNCKREPPPPQPQQQQHQHRRQQQSFNNLLLSNHLPPWLSCPQPNYQPPLTQQAGSSAGAPSQQIELASLQPFMHSDNNPNPSPSPSPSHGFFSTPSTTTSSGTLLPCLFSSQAAHHMSATAMLQRAAQMGVTMSTNIQLPSDLSPPPSSHHNHQINMTNPSRGHHHHLLQAASNSSSGGGSSSTSSTHVSANANASGHSLLAPLPPSSSELAASSLAYYSHDDHIYNNNNNKLMMIGGDHQAGFNHHVMMMSSTFSNSNSSSASNSSAPAATSSSSALAGFEEALMISGSGLMINNVPSSTNTTRGGVGVGVGGGGGSDGLTRDFLGLRSVSQKELMNMAACGNMDRNQYHHNHTDQQLMSFTYGQENNNISPSTCTPNWQQG